MFNVHVAVQIRGNVSVRRVSYRVNKAERICTILLLDVMALIVECEWEGSVACRREYSSIFAVNFSQVAGTALRGHLTDLYLAHALDLREVGDNRIATTLGTAVVRLAAICRVQPSAAVSTV